jgi:hypothetical protein
MSLLMPRSPNGPRVDGINRSVRRLSGLGLPAIRLWDAVPNPS